MTPLILSLFSPIVELFPNLYMSWWVPNNGKLKDYLNAWRRRIMIVFVVWLPILYSLGAITSTLLQLFISLLVFVAFGLRLYMFDKSLKKLKRDDQSFTEPSKIPEIIYFTAFSLIGWILYDAVPDKQFLVPYAILSIFIGAFMMATFRQRSQEKIYLDVIGRIIFSLGFLLNLYNLARV